MTSICSKRSAAKLNAAVTFTVTTADDFLGKRLEPGAPVSSRRLAALRSLSQRGILTGIALMPVLPFIEDTEENVREIVRLAHAAGAKYILPAFGMTLRDRQRAYYYDKLDRLFPDMRVHYEKTFGRKYSAPAQNSIHLGYIFTELCEKFGIATKMPVFASQKRLPSGKEQLPLF